MPTAREAVERKIVANETEVERVKKQLEDAIGDREEKLLLQQQLAALRQKEVLLMQQQAAAYMTEAAAGDTYEPQAWNQFMQKMDKWSDKMIAFSVLWRPWGSDLPPVEAAKKAA